MTLDTIQLTLLSLTIILFLLQSLYYLIIYARPLKRARKKKIALPEPMPPVSVIVYAKNESENLRKHIPALLTQNYPDYEIIVVNDGSTDESDEVLKRFENDYKNLYHTYIPEDVKYLSRKKLALTMGIKAAKNEILLFTEANCKPVSEYWIARMARNYSPSTSIVLGFCAYGPHKGFFHKLVAYDNLVGGLQYLSSALAHNPYTGNGRNLSYRKELFFAHKGYYKSLNLHAGDDDLFVNEYATPTNTQTEYTTESITQMAKIEQFSVWKEMKVSRAATQRFYKGSSLTLYRVEGVSSFLFFLGTLGSIGIGLYGNGWISAGGILLYVLHFILKAVILYKSSVMLRQKPDIAWLPILELIRPMFNLYVRIYRIFRGKNDYTFRLG